MHMPGTFISALDVLTHLIYKTVYSILSSSISMLPTRELRNRDFKSMA